MRINYILIDFENVQPALLRGLDAEHFRVFVFVGANQTKVNFETAAALQALGERAQYIKISGNGPNALDFHIAFHIGQIAALNPTAFFHIISKDTGFDPLIQHLKERKVFAARSKDIADIPLLKAAKSRSLPEKVAAVVANLQQRGSSKPRTIKTLSGTINSLFQKRLTDNELASLLENLQTEGIVTVQDTRVSYSLPIDEEESSNQ